MALEKISNPLEKVMEKVSNIRATEPEVESNSDIEEHIKSAASGKISQMFGTKFRNATFGNFEIYGSKEKQEAQRKTIELMKEWAYKPFGKKWLILIGDNGTGKNHLLAAALKLRLYLIKIKRLKTRNSIVSEIVAPGNWQSWKCTPLITELLEKTNDAYRLRENCKHCELLILNELGHIKEPEWRSAVLENVICERYDNELPIVFITNVPRENQVMKDGVLVTEYPLKELVGRILWDRMQEVVQFVPMVWQSYRVYNKGGV